MQFGGNTDKLRIELNSFHRQCLEESLYTSSTPIARAFTIYTGAYVDMVISRMHYTIDCDLWHSR